MMMWGYGPWYNNGAWGNGNWWMGFVMMVVQILFWGLILWFGFSLFKRNGRSSSGLSGRNEALDILRERYARGEIETEEFQRRREELTK